MKQQVKTVKNVEEKDLLQEYDELDKKIEETIKKIKSKKIKAVK